MTLNIKVKLLNIIFYIAEVFKIGLKLQQVMICNEEEKKMNELAATRQLLHSRQKEFSNLQSLIEKVAGPEPISIVCVFHTDFNV